MEVCAHVAPLSPNKASRAILPKAAPNGNWPIDSRKMLCYPRTRVSHACSVTGTTFQTSGMFLNAISSSSRLHLIGPWWLRAIVVCVGIAVFLTIPLDTSAKRKSRRAPRPEPELKILEVKVSPNPYVVSAGSAEFSALVQLPKELNGATLLEVSSFVTSPSKTSIRFLSVRKALEEELRSENGAVQPQISIILPWDGMDHNKAPADAGTYQYEVRAKLLVNGEKGPRTQLVSWPKRGTLEVK